MDERLKQLEERNERLFRMLGSLDSRIDHNPEDSFTINAVLDMLEEIAYGY